MFNKNLLDINEFNDKTIPLPLLYSEDEFPDPPFYNGL